MKIFLVRRLPPLFLIFSLWVTSNGCSLFNNPFDIFGGSDSSDGVTHEEKDVSGTLALSLGGVRSGTNEILAVSNQQLLNLTNNDPDLFSLTPLPGFSSFMAGQGGVVNALRVGIGYVTPVYSGQTSSPIQVTISPQTLIQVLVGEARGELAREATTDGNGDVKLSSVSVTGDALGAVIRNRINLINDSGDPDLFKANATLYGSDTPISYYDAVIEASSGSIYQFSSVSPTDPSNIYYLAAEQRSQLAVMDDATLLTAYDQAVLTAADIFNSDTEDSTGGSFGFYSPTEDEYALLSAALRDGDRTLPPDCGTSDSNFPSLAPVQVLILSGIAPTTGDINLPSFVFVRTRSASAAAVTNEP